MRRRRSPATVACVALLCGLLAAAPAAACGGLFCSTGPNPPQPVDQNAERIIFVVNGDGTITAHVQIQYRGSPENFAWVVPVPSVPDVKDSQQDYFTDLDQATSLQVTLPAPDQCASSGGGGFGCGAADYAAANSTPDAKPPVTVHKHSYTNNYEYHVLGAEKTADLVKWLQDNDYNVSDNMTPVMDAYNSPTMRFLALKLRAGKSASDIVPIAMTYNAENPMVPIKLTAVAAQPLMGILVFIVGASPYRPANYDVVDPDNKAIVFDATGRTNYFAWVAKVADEANGQRWVREYVGGNTASGAAKSLGPIVSRFYTRMSPQHMTVDPMFVKFDSPAASREATLDLSSKPTLWGCGVYQDRVPSRCEFNFCGQGAKCIELAGAGVACQCPAGQVATPVQDPDGQNSVTCVPEKNPYGVTDQAAGVGTPIDPCNGYNCGPAGTCVQRGGFPTCQCASGAVAELLNSGNVICTVVDASARRSQLEIKAKISGVLRGDGGSNGAAGGGHAKGLFTFSALMLLLFGLHSVLRRRRAPR
ncbi:MAG: DUF2330 domain-containing protein [Myxococcales bacterium]|nr:DUF2330 domain-containing protein [Myxococcales bacterium]